MAVRKRLRLPFSSPIALLANQQAVSDRLKQLNKLGSAGVINFLVGDTQPEANSDHQHDVYLVLTKEWLIGCRQYIGLETGMFLMVNRSGFRGSVRLSVEL